MAQKFRGDVVNLYKKCIITGYAPSECDAAHIISKIICNTHCPELATCPTNGLLLSKSLQKSFDDLNWTFDIYKSYEYKKGKIKLPTISADENKPYMINNYLNSTYTIEMSL